MAQEDEITQWLSRSGRSMLDLEAARLLAAESQDHWYVASHGDRGYIVGKMTMQKFSARHILVKASGQAMLFATAEDAVIFLQTELKVMKPHVFKY